MKLGYNSQLKVASRALASFGGAVRCTLLTLNRARLAVCPLNMWRMNSYFMKSVKLKVNLKIKGKSYCSCVISESKRNFAASVSYWITAEWIFWKNGDGFSLDEDQVCPLTLEIWATAGPPTALWWTDSRLMFPRSPNYSRDQPTSLPRPSLPSNN